MVSTRLSGNFGGGGESPTAGPEPGPSKSARNSLVQTSICEPSTSGVLVKPAEPKPPPTLLEFPAEILEKIFSYLSFKNIAHLRPVCHKINSICCHILNTTFQRLQGQMLVRFQSIKARMPRRESARRNHPLACESDIVETLHMRLTLLQMTFGKHIERKHCCFFAGEQVDGHMSVEQLRKRTYQDELRKQIEEKRQLEAQQREKEKREEEMILRVEEQQLRMKLEFEMEQAQRRHRVEKKSVQKELLQSAKELSHGWLKIEEAAEKARRKRSQLEVESKEAEICLSEMTGKLRFAIAVELKTLHDAMPPLMKTEPTIQEVLKFGTTYNDLFYILKLAAEKRMARHVVLSLPKIFALTGGNHHSRQLYQKI